MKLDVKHLQRQLGTTPDGVIGRTTLTALFARCGAAPMRAAELALSANVHFRRYGILESGLQLAHFMAQLGHESGGFRYMEEIASGQAYEGRKDLGNVQAGDGRRFKGRGPIQLTGRANYRRFGCEVGIDLETHPEIVALPSVGLLVGCLYWIDRECGGDAEADDIEAVTRKINGGLNGLADRKAWLAKLKPLIGVKP